MNRHQVNFFRHNRGDYDESHSSYATRKRNKRPYVYRRETSLSATDNNGHPNLTISGKLREKENFIWGGAPGFNQIKEDDRHHKSGNEISKEELEEFMKEEEEKKQKKKEDRKKIPTTQEIREHLRMIAEYHKKEMNEMMPSAYPLLGPAGKQDDESGGGSGRRNEKAENSDGKALTYKQRSGYRKKAAKAPAKKRGKKS